MKDVLGTYVRFRARCCPFTCTLPSEQNGEAFFLRIPCEKRQVPGHSLSAVLSCTVECWRTSQVSAHGWSGNVVSVRGFVAPRCANVWSFDVSLASRWFEPHLGIPTWPIITLSVQCLRVFRCSIFHRPTKKAWFDGRQGFSSKCFFSPSLLDPNRS